MGAYGVLRDGEDLDSALRRFEHHCKREERRPWTKRRFGYYEKPSALRRKRKRVRRMSAGRDQRVGRWISYNLKIDFAEQFRRPGPNNAVGH